MLVVVVRATAYQLGAIYLVEQDVCTCSLKVATSHFRSISPTPVSTLSPCVSAGYCDLNSAENKWDCCQLSTLEKLILQYFVLSIDISLLISLGVFSN